MMPIIKWSKITREERFFTSMLYHDILHDDRPILNLFGNNLEVLFDISLVDAGYEVCFFRDAFHYKPALVKERQPLLEKQTFDLVLWLSDQSLVIIEAKAQQGFHMDQINALKQSREIILRISAPRYPIGKIYLFGLCSSKYNLKKSTEQEFDSIIRWNEIASLYPSHEEEYDRADYIYRD
ncbi:hypothetical protein ACFLRP_03615 [Bacteroidota bacterium]